MGAEVEPGAEVELEAEAGEAGEEEDFAEGEAEEASEEDEGAVASEGEAIKRSVLPGWLQPSSVDGNSFLEQVLTACFVAQKGSCRQRASGSVGRRRADASSARCEAWTLGVYKWTLLLQHS